MEWRHLVIQNQYSQFVSNRGDDVDDSRSNSLKGAILGRKVIRVPNLRKSGVRVDHRQWGGWRRVTLEPLGCE